MAGATEGTFLMLGAAAMLLPDLLWRGIGLRRWVPLSVLQIGFGLLLGPSGLALTTSGERLVPPDLAGALAALPVVLQGPSWLALVFFAFLCGMHVDLDRQQGRALLLTALGSVLLPLLLGGIAGSGLVLLWPGLAGPALQGHPAAGLVFSFSFGLALAVTAMPVLAAILQELPLSPQLRGQALGCAAMNDALLWALLAGLLLLAGQAGAGGDITGLLRLAGAGGLGLCLWRGIPCLLRGGADSGNTDTGDTDTGDRRTGGGVLACLCAAVFLAAACTAALGVHPLLGAFAVGLRVPRPLARELTGRFETFVTVVLLPFFFLQTGLTCDLSSVWTAGLGGAGVPFWLLGPVVLLAVLGKMVGTCVPARLSGLACGRQMLVLGALMQCKGLMEIVILTLLRDIGIISPACFALLILMALIMTAITMPFVRILMSGKNMEISFI